MKYPRLYKIILPLILAVSACSSYEELIISDRILLPDESRGYVFSDTIIEKKADSKSGKQKALPVTSEKYLAKSMGFNPESKIMNRGVEEALKGNYSEAEILFNEIREVITDGSVENNLAVICELTKRKKDAERLYTEALLKSPENTKFKSNLSSFINHNKYKVEN